MYVIYFAPIGKLTQGVLRDVLSKFSSTGEGNYLISNWCSPKSEGTDRCYSCHYHSTE